MNFTELIERVKWLPKVDFGIIDFFQILILALSIYYLTKSVYKTRAWILVKGLFVIGLVYFIICLMEMAVLKTILQSLFSVLLIAIVIMLQPELQKLVELIGKKRFTDFKSFVMKKNENPTWYTTDTIEELASACEAMSSAKTGALIVLERGIPLDEYIESGIMVGAKISNQLMINIFEKNTPLHDGAVIIKNDLVESATSYLPLSSNPDIAKSLGTRHRAAIGISENSDCVVIVVSEETGGMSLCYGGKIQHIDNKEQLISELNEHALRNDEVSLNIKNKKKHSPLWMKIIALVGSFVVWISVLSGVDPVVTKTIDNVPVITMNTHILDEAAQSYSIKSGSVISIKVKGKRSLVDNMTNNDVLATADFQQMSLVYAVPITIEPNDQYASVEILYDKNHIMQLTLEDVVQTEIPVEVELIGDNNNDLLVSVQNVEIENIKVTCPQSLALLLDRAVVTIDAYGKTNNFVASATPIIYDKNGEEVASNLITLNKDQLRISLNVYEVKSVPLNIQLASQSLTSEFYYVLDNSTIDPVFVRVAADVETMDNLDAINVSVSPDENSADFNAIMINLNQYLPDGVYLAKNQDAQITVDLDLVKYQRCEIELPIDYIKIIGASKDAIVTITSAPSIIVAYCDVDKVDVDGLTIDMLDPTLKILENSPGKYNANIICTDVDGILFQNSIKVQYIIEKDKD